jgi:tetratricopeptide (TPR) repeat protein
MLLRRALGDDGAAQPWILHGPEGVGTSALARELVEQALLQGHAVAWVSAADPITLALEWHELARATNHWTGHHELGTAWQHFHPRALLAAGPAVLVIDDVRAPADVMPLLADRGETTVVLTTREDARAWRYVDADGDALDLAPCLIQLDPLRDDDVAAWLERATGPKCGDAQRDVAGHVRGNALAMVLLAARARRLKAGLPRVARALAAEATDDPIDDALEIAARTFRRNTTALDVLVCYATLADAPIPKRLGADCARALGKTVREYRAAERAAIRRGLLEAHALGCWMHPALRARLRARIVPELWPSLAATALKAVNAAVSAAHHELEHQRATLVMAHGTALARCAPYAGPLQDLLAISLAPTAEWLELVKLPHLAAPLYADTISAIRARGPATTEEPLFGRDTLLSALRGRGRTLSSAGLPGAVEPLEEALAVIEAGEGGAGATAVSVLLELGAAHAKLRARDACCAANARAYEAALALGGAGAELASNAAHALALEHRHANDFAEELRWVEREIACTEGHDALRDRQFQARERLVEVLRRLSRLDEALAACTELTALAEAVYGEDSEEASNAFWSLGRVHEARREPADAAEAYESARETREFGGHGIEREQGSLSWFIGVNHEAAGHWTHALAGYEKGAEIYARVRDANHPMIALCRLGAARALHELGRTHEALAAWEQALAPLGGDARSLDAMERGSGVHAYVHRAALERALDRPEAALAWLERAERARVRYDVPRDARSVAHIAVERAEVLRALEDYAGARAVVLEGLEHVAGVLPADDTEVVRLRRALGERAGGGGEPN